MQRGEKQAQSVCMGIARLGARICPSPEGRPEGARAETRPKAEEFFLGPHSSRGGGKEGNHCLPGRLPAQTLPRPVVQITVDPLEFGFADAGKRRTLGVEPPNQSVRVLVGAPLPGMIRMCKEHIQTRGSRHDFVIGKFLAVVERQPHARRLRHLTEHRTENRSDFSGLLGIGSRKQRETCLALHGRCQVPGPRSAVDQVAFPMSHRLSGLHLRWPTVDQALVRDPPSMTPILVRTASPPLAVSTRQLSPQVAPGLGIRVNMLVNRFLAYPGVPFQTRPPADDLRRPTLSKLLLGLQAHRRGKTPRPGSPRPFTGFPVRLLGPIALLPSIPGQLPADTARRPSQPPRNLADPTSLSTPTVDQPTLFPTYALVSHVAPSVVQPKSLTYRMTFSITQSVAMATRARAW